MVDYGKLLKKLADGTIRQINPFTGTEVLTIPGRSSRPAAKTSAAAQPSGKRDPEDYCDLCEGKYLNTPPEKERLIQKGAGYVSLKNLPAGELSLSRPLFRRIPNLFEILTFDYWQKNFNVTLSAEQENRKREYISDPDGRRHLLNVIDLKIKRSGLDPAKIDEQQKLAGADAFFGGGHELIVAGRHYDKKSWPTPRLYSSGEMSSDEHFHFFKFTVSGMAACYAANPAVRYVVVFQNWLKPAGASFEHLHKQLVASDRHGPIIEQMLNASRLNPDIFDEYGPAMASALDLVIAENEHAIAFADVGHAYPTVVVQSKSKTADPCRLNNEELRGMSDLVHSMHRAIGSDVAYNEEWYYAPRGADITIPWHVYIKQRINTPAGFEGITGIYINPVDPQSLKQQLVQKLQDTKTG